MFRKLLLVALVAVAMASVPKGGQPAPYPGYSLKPVLASIGLPKFYRPKYSLSGLAAYLQQADVSEAQFIGRVRKYGPTIKSLLHALRKQYSGIPSDLLQLSVLRYYGCEPRINHKFQLGNYFNRYLRNTKIPSSYRYNARYVNSFLTGFKSYLRKHAKPQKIILPVPAPVPAPYPGYKLKAVLKSLGLPSLYNAKYSLGGIVSYLKISRISQATFIRRVKKYGPSIKKIVYKYKKQYSGYQADLLQAAALRYYGIPKKSKYTVSFIVAFQKSLRLRINYKYSVSYVSKFLVRFSKILITPAYPGYKLKAVLKGIGLPSLHNAKYSLGGIISYLKIVKISHSTFISRVRKYGPSIKKIVYKYKKQYSGYQADLLQVAALRYYGIPQKSKYAVNFIVAFRQALKVRVYYKYSVSYVSRFLVRFSKILITPPYPGYKLKAVLKGLGLPRLYNARYTLSGLVSYLKVTKISHATFISRIKKYGPSIKKIVYKYKRQYSGYQADLLQVAALRYYGVPQKSKYAVSFIVAFRQALKVRVYYKYSAGYVSAFLVRFSKILITPPYPGYKLKAVLKSIGLPSLYNARYSLGGLVSYLKIAKISHATFISRIKKYGPSIRRIVYKYKKQYSGYQADLLQVAALHYYGISKKSKYSVSFAVAFQQALKFRVYHKYSVSYVSKFLVRFSKILITPPYPGYKLKAVLKSIGLPSLHNARYSLGGLVSYLKIAKISHATFISRVEKYGPSIKKIVLQYKKQYSGYQADLLQVAALRYYGISRRSRYTVSFIVAFKQALKVRVYYKYSVSYVSKFLVRFSKYLVTPSYPGYKLKVVLQRIGLPSLYKPKASLGGLVSYLKITKISQAAFISRIRKYGSKIKAIVYRYKKQYSGSSADLLQLCALRYYSFPLAIRSRVQFGIAFRQFLRTQSLKQYNPYYVSKFLRGFIKHIQKYQLKTYKKYTSKLW